MRGRFQVRPTGRGLGKGRIMRGKLSYEPSRLFAGPALEAREFFARRQRETLETVRAEVHCIAGGIRCSVILGAPTRYQREQLGERLARYAQLRAIRSQASEGHYDDCQCRDCSLAPCPYCRERLIDLGDVAACDDCRAEDRAAH